MTTKLDLYNSYVAGADANDRRHFDAALLGWLLGAVSEDEARAALEFAAAQVNGPKS